MNSLVAIHPYKAHGMWVFDDAAAGLVQEPFVAGADTIIDRAVAAIADAQQGFTLLFSAQPFPGHQLELRWCRPELSGNVYRCVELEMEGWLCPALLKYFDVPPERIYVQCLPKR